LNLPDVIRYAGIVLFVAGVALFVVGLATLRTLESDNNDLVTRGIYSKIRHPMYLAFILWLVGLPLFYGGAVSLALSPAFMANVLWWRTIEERQLEQRFVSTRITEGRPCSEGSFGRKQALVFGQFLIASSLSGNAHCGMRRTISFQRGSTDTA
jgi:uncharacterized membrane protein